MNDVSRAWWSHAALDHAPVSGLCLALRYRVMIAINYLLVRWAIGRNGVTQR